MKVFTLILLKNVRSIKYLHVFQVLCGDTYVKILTVTLSTVFMDAFDEKIMPKLEEGIEDMSYFGL